jgi:CDP-6-deoxy-D-xylo-4-hexulose-3-dehydrase
MKDIDLMIKELISSLGEEFKVLKYVYNKNKQFIPGATPIYYSGPYWEEEEVVEAIKSLLIGSWLSSGEKVKTFENVFARKINQKYAVMVNSGSSANLVMISALKKYFNWQDGDEIILSVVGFPTTLAPIIQNNLKPVFIDIEMNSLNFDLNLIENKINQKTKAIFVSPVLGNPMDFDRLVDICCRNNIELILDNCDSLGSKWRDKYLNEYTIVSSNSFYPSHHITTGEGGMVVSNNKEIIRIARSFAWWGRDCFCVGAGNLIQNGSCGNRFDKWLDNYDGIIDHKYLFTNIGYNLKPLDLQGAIGLVQINRFDEIHDKRKKSKNVIGGLFEHYIKGVRVPQELKYAETSWFGTPIICDNKQLKNNLVSYLEDKKIQTRNYFAGNILLHPGYKHLGDFKEYPEANKVLDQVFFVGASPHYNTDIFNYIEDCLRRFDK